MFLDRGSTAATTAATRRRWRPAARDRWAGRCAAGAGDARLYLEPWTPSARSCVWTFNALTRHAPLPPGRSRAPDEDRDGPALRALPAQLFARWDVLAARHELPAELPVVELGPGNGDRAKSLLDELLSMSRTRGRDYHERIRYVLCDPSVQRLDVARTTTIEHAARVRCAVVDPARPGQDLAALRGRVALALVSGVYAALPSDDVVRVDGRFRRSEARAYLPGRACRALAERTGLPITVLPQAIAHLAAHGPQQLAERMPDQFPRPRSAAEFGRVAWSATALEERHVPVDLDEYDIAPGIPGRILRPLVEASTAARLPVSNGAAASFVELLDLLHPAGVLRCHDRFTTGSDAAAAAFRGPGRVDGTVTSRVNAAVLSTVARARGFQVALEPTGRPRSCDLAALTASR